MAIFKRGPVYWYHFVFNGQHIQESTKQGNPRTARQMEAAHRTALAKGEVGIREKKAAPTVAQFCRDRVEPFTKAKFEKPSPKTWLWYRFGLNTIRAHESLADKKLDDVTMELHSLRHTYLTRLGLAGVEAFTIMRLAGHGSVTVSQRYVHPTPQAMEMRLRSWTI